METMMQDLRYGIRTLIKRPAFTAIAVVALALGIGANSAIFSVVNAVLLRPLPYKDPNRLVILWEQAVTMETSVAYPNFIDWRERSKAFDDFGAFRRDSFNLTGAGEPERLGGRMVSAGFFSTFGASPYLGRYFTAEDDKMEASPAAVLNYGFWQRRFGGDQTLVGKQLTLNNRSFTVVGITASGFQFGAGADVYVPIGLYSDRFQERGSHPGLYVVARMKPGISMEQARTDMDGVMAQLGEQYPKTNANRRIHIESLYENAVQDVRSSLLVLFGAVGFVLLIACANVANLLLARAATRRKEIAVRVALGASRWRIIRQLLTESVALAAMGGALGLVVALWGTSFLVSSVPDNIPRLQEAEVDLRVLGFTILVSFLTGIVFGLVPALQASKPDLNESLKEGERGSTGLRHRMRSAFVITEVALALVLLIGAGLMARSFQRLQEINLGFNSKNVLTMQLSITATKEDGDKVRNFMNELGEKVRSLPGIESAALSNGLPFAGAMENSVALEGDDRSDPSKERMSVLYVTSPQYFKTMGVKLIKGRFFTEQDGKDSPKVAVIDESFARKHLPNQDPIGKRLLDPNNVPNVEIVGVVEHVKHYGLDGNIPVDPQYYLPLVQVPDEYIPVLVNRLNLIAKTSSEPLSIVSSIRSQVLALNKDQPIFNAVTMDQIISRSISERRFSMFLLTIFAITALLLASLGIYGVMSYTVAQRTHEIGIRIALGAEERDVIKLVVKQGMSLVLIGVAIGLAGAFALTRVMSSMLYGVSATDPITFGGISMLLTLIAMIACWAPARRATKVDPIIALRYE